MKKLLLIVFVALGFILNAQTYTKKEVRILNRAKALQTNYQNQQDITTEKFAISSLSAITSFAILRIANMNNKPQNTNLILITGTTAVISGMLGFMDSERNMNLKYKLDTYLKSNKLIINPTGKIQFK